MFFLYFHPLTPPEPLYVVVLVCDVRKVSMVVSSHRRTQVARCRPSRRKPRNRVVCATSKQKRLFVN